MQAGTTTRVPAVLGALQVLAQGALPDLQVLYGPKGREKLQKRFLAIGATATPGQPAVEAVFGARGDGLRVSPVEELTIRCVLGSWSGSRDMAVLVAATAADFAALDLALRADAHLGGLTDLVKLGAEVQWFPDQGDSDALLEVDFTITCRAYL
jgi:hypothetical protein